MKTSSSSPNRRARERERGAPLARARLRREPVDAGLLVRVRLRHGGVRLVRARGRDALVLVVDARRRLERAARGAARGTAASGATACTPRGRASGISMSGSGETSWRMSSIGKIAPRSAGPAGSFVCGFSGGIWAPGMSGFMLTQCVGIAVLGQEELRLLGGHAAILRLRASAGKCGFSMIPSTRARRARARVATRMPAADVGHRRALASRRRRAAPRRPPRRPRRPSRSRRRRSRGAGPARSRRRRSRRRTARRSTARCRAALRVPRLGGGEVRRGVDDGAQSEEHAHGRYAASARPSWRERTSATSPRACATPRTAVGGAPARRRTSPVMCGWSA